MRIQRMCCGTATLDLTARVLLDNLTGNGRIVAAPARVACWHFAGARGTAPLHPQLNQGRTNGGLARLPNSCERSLRKSSWLRLHLTFEGTRRARVCDAGAVPE
jgi:hypothetical protein